MVICPGHRLHTLQMFTKDVSASQLVVIHGLNHFPPGLCASCSPDKATGTKILSSGLPAHVLDSVDFSRGARRMPRELRQSLPCEIQVCAHFDFV